MLGNLSATPVRRFTTPSFPNPGTSFPSSAWRAISRPSLVPAKISGAAFESPGQNVTPRRPAHRCTWPHSSSKVCTRTWFDRRLTSVGTRAMSGGKSNSADSPATNARDRIGSGPYYNSLGALVAADINALHARTGDPAVFIDEHGGRINGQWTGSPAPLQHDILTGSTTAGMLNVGMTCTSWTAATGASFVGHADGLGPGMSMAAMYTPWNSSHAAEGANTAPLGGAGRIYCFVAN